MRRTLRSKFLISRKSVNVFLHITCTKGMFSRTSPLCAAPCVIKNISPRFSPTIFYRDANSVLLRAHLCTAVLIGSMRRTLCSKLFIGRAWRSIYTYVQRECSAEPSMRRTLCHYFPSLPVSRLRFFIACNFTTLPSTPLYSSRLYAQKTLCSKEFIKRA